jgi:amino-acid N-acetyltransferase
VHLIGFEHQGALLQELFTHDGVGTVITRESLENIREARPDDIGALIALIEPMEQEGILVHRPRELLERELDRFSIMEHDKIIVGCAAFYRYSDEVAELACLAVHPDHREWGYGEQLLRRVEKRAKKAGVKRLFVLTTRTEHWFVERGFKLAGVDELPDEKRQMYNYKRRSKVLFKRL